MKKTEKLKKIIDLYNEYCINEFGEDSCYSEDKDGTVLGLLYTTVGENDEYEIQIEYDFENQLISVTLTGEEEEEPLTYSEKEDFDEIIDDLEKLDFQGWYNWASDIVASKFNRDDIEF